MHFPTALRDLSSKLKTRVTLWGSLRARLLFTLAGALTPILLFASLQAYFAAEQSRADRRTDLLRISDGTVDDVEQSLQKAETVATLFKSELAAGRCTDIYDRAKTVLPALANVAQSDASGAVICEVVGDTSPALTRDFKLMVEKNDQDIVRSVAHQLQATGAWVTAIAHRLEDSEGGFNGFAIFTVGIDALSSIADPGSANQDIEVAIADETGRIFNSERFSQINPDWLRRADLAGRGELISHQTVASERIDVVIRPLGETRVYAVISRSAPGIFNRLSAAPLRSLALPLLAFTIALLATWLALDYLVLKWLRRLHRLAARYGRGEFAAQDTKAFAGAPAEFADFARTMDRMSNDMGERDASLRAAIEKRDDAVREIHHRVKNNLQIVTSYLNLQSRQTEDEQAIAVLSAARHRIDALSIVHQTLYQHERLDSVQVKPFLESLLAHLNVALGMEDMNISIEQDICSVLRASDDAIPLALFTVEAVTNAVKYAFSSAGGKIFVTLRRGDDALILTIEDNGCGLEDSLGGAVSGTGVGGRLMTAFAKQLKGTLKRGPTEKGGYLVVLQIPH